MSAANGIQYISCILLRDDWLKLPEAYRPIGAFVKNMTVRALHPRKTRRPIKKRQFSCGNGQALLSLYGYSRKKYLECISQNWFQISVNRFEYVIRVKFTMMPYE